MSTVVATSAIIGAAAGITAQAGADAGRMSATAAAAASGQGRQYDRAHQGKCKPGRCAASLGLLLHDVLLWKVIQAVCRPMPFHTQDSCQVFEDYP
ncbi:hypothetical protein D554_0334 [Bordetella holmesii 30539]|uniref:N-acetyltransferase YedL n=1 Tax=Bordetella holmesii 1058 TaxID=1247648 RepID=A0ABN0S184_9BORD|nr:hypothetical protein D560_0840 [Bordetella holmesii ATCC 51541]AIT25504.1 hypothetical protein D558_0824 [Bordetella holmesii 44057]EWM46074.1 hypothetical protein D555_0847 [Bordetella holmesii 35009]EXF89136.1 hypothetical protein D554_0334 [Bordetella holmesii 30539]EXX95342.1 hypothetical protein D559_2778 [Bordetella holmesii 1058]KAK88022.1 hypothetical protein L496_2491 [Bordetella holmesii CDC-H572-BH]